MRHAVHGAESPDEVAGVDWDDLSRGEELCQRVEGDAVVGIVEDWNEHDAVCDVEIGVAGGEAALLEDDGAGHGEFDDRQRLGVLVGGGLESAEIFGERFVIYIFAIRFDHGDDCVGSDEAG